MLTIDPVTSQLVASTLQKLRQVAPSLVRGALDMSNQENREFAKTPDDPAQHNLFWHQYGILTHSWLFQQHLQTTVVDFLRQWRLEDAVTAALSESIDGRSKWQLLQIAAVLHDVGKFTARTFKERPSSTMAWHFGKHEVHSGKLIRQGVVKQFLKKASFTAAQIEYIASCAERHFKLGEMRNEIKNHPGGYSMAFARSPRLGRVITGILNSPSDGPFALEIFLCFLADNLSKVHGDLCATANTDAGIQQEQPRIKKELKNRNLPPQLIDGALQMPVNIEVSRRALEMRAPSH
ncbi:MAG TPA: HD domain-containing protein [Verrucomicrobiae bacterium]|nr:HD domain-containing protein [Verrucomicrobiae bacterium]